MGAANGFSPGPLMTLVITQTMRHDLREGIKISLTPLIGGIPVILISLWIYSLFSNSNYMLGLISLVGAGFLLIMGVSNIRFRSLSNSKEVKGSASLIKGTLATLLNPAPYAFWISVGAPLAIETAKDGPSTIIAFLGAFFFSFIAANVGMSLVAAKASQYLTGVLLIWVIRSLGLILIIYSGVFLWNGLSKLSLI
jgi:threonine/homoserine/homoserine lactone efflux protein